MTNSSQPKNTRSLLSFISKKPITAFVALVAAVLIWYYASRKVEKVKEFQIPFELTLSTENRDFVISEVTDSFGQTQKNTLDISLKGPTGTLADVNEESLSIQKTISLPTIPPDEHIIEKRITISESDLKLPLGLHIYQPDPPRLNLKIEESITKKKPLPLNRDRFFEGEPAPGFKLASTSASDSSIRLKGPYSLMQNIDDLQIVPRVKIDLEDRNESTIKQQVNLKLIPSQPITLQPQSTIVEARITNRKQKVTRSVPVGIWVRPTSTDFVKHPGWNMKPEEGKLKTTFRIPQNWEENRFQQSRIHLVFFPTSSDRNSLQNPSPYTVETERLTFVFQGMKPEDRNKIEVVKIHENDIIFLGGEVIQNE